MDLKLVDYSETSSSSSGEEHKDTVSKKIAVVQAVQQSKPSVPTENLQETTTPLEVNPDASRPSPQPTDETEDLYDNDVLPIDIEYSQPEV